MIRNLVLASMITFLVTACGGSDWKTTDSVEIISESRSPDGKHIATVFLCSGGGAAGYVYTNVNLRKATEEFSQRDVLMGRHLWNSFTDIEVSWQDPTSLSVSYSWTSENSEHRNQNSRMVAEKDGVQITYVSRETGAKAPPTN